MPNQIDVLSARLHLTPLSAQDREPIAKIFAAPETSRYLGVDFTVSCNLDPMMERRLSYVGSPGTGHWLIRTRSGEGVGLAHLRDSWELPGGVPEIGWYLDIDHVGHGYATEAVVALLDHGTRNLGMPSVWALIHRQNQASHAVAQRAGFIEEGQGIYYGAPHNVLRFNALD